MLWARGPATARIERLGPQIKAVVLSGFERAGGHVQLLRLYFSNEFAADMDAHVRTEFPLLRDRLRASAA